MKEYKIINKMKNSNMCFVCGLENESSLGTHFYELDDKRVLGVVVGQEIHQSYPNRMHGGNITALLDEAIGRALQPLDADGWGVTIELTTRYLKPVPLNETIYVVGELTDNRRIFKGKGYVCDQNGEILARASGSYMKGTVEQITGQQELAHTEWYDATGPLITSVMLPE